jgi:hypothetical protein
MHYVWDSQKPCGKWPVVYIALIGYLIMNRVIVKSNDTPRPRLVCKIFIANVGRWIFCASVDERCDDRGEQIFARLLSRKKSRRPKFAIKILQTTLGRGVSPERSLTYSADCTKRT